MHPNTDQRTHHLTITLLQYFTLARTLAALGQDARMFSGYSRQELQATARGLIAAGFLYRVRGKTRGAVYRVTQDGLTTLRALETQRDTSLLRVTDTSDCTPWRDDSLRA